MDVIVLPVDCRGAAQGPKDPPKTLQNFAHAVREAWEDGYIDEANV
jgi:hypothetical protein